jgi:DNA-binding MarR family transcriptional regulator
MSRKQPTTALTESAPTRVRVFRKLIHTIGLLQRVMQPYFAQFGISGAQWGVLRNLYRAEKRGEPGLRLTDLGRRMLIRPPSVTGIADRLEKMRVIVRQTSDTDARAKRVALTEKGRRLVERVLTVHDGQMIRVMGGLSSREQDEMERLLDRLGSHLEGLDETRDFESAARRGNGVH